jgi:uncharacterized protein YbjQ (UPF0145 family)
MIIVTTPSMEGRRIKEYLGLVSGDGGMLMVSATGTAVVIE